MKTMIQLLKDVFREAGAYQVASSGQPFKLASGKESNYYVDCRRVLLSPSGIRLATLCMSNLIVDYLCETKRKASKCYVGATGVGGCPLLGGILFSMCQSPANGGFVVRDVQKDHGLKHIVEGHIADDAPIFMIDDVLTTGGSVISAISRLYEAKQVKPEAVFVLVDREEGGVDNLMTATGCKVCSVMKVSDLA